ncbi:MAG: hypothetical protein RI964_1903 [Pseudomonadota bacterium]|jgi:hypothetical protein
MVRIFIRDEDECGKGATNAPDTLQRFKIPTLFGRNTELDQLHQAWADSASHLLLLSAAIGVGKTALIERWLYDLQQQYWHDAEAVYVWSFYPEPQHESPSLAVDAFFQHALQWFGDQPSDALIPTHQAERLARQIQANHTLLILDGVEHLLTPNAPPTLRDPRLTLLLERLAEYNPGLCIVMTRQSLSSVFAPYEAAHCLELAPLPLAACVQLLRHKGVQGSETKLQQIVTDHEPHALTLKLLGGYLSHWHNGDWLGLEHIPVLFEKRVEGRHARRILTANAQRLVGSSAESLLFVLSTYPQPIDRQALLQTLVPVRTSWFKRCLGRWAGQSDTLAAVVQPFKRLSLPKQQQVLRHLQSLGLLQVTGGGLSLPEWVREFFYQQFRQAWPQAWQQAKILLAHPYRPTPPTASTLRISHTLPNIAALPTTYQKPKVNQVINDLPRITVAVAPQQPRSTTLAVQPLTTHPIAVSLVATPRVTPVLDVTPAPVPALDTPPPPKPLEASPLPALVSFVDAERVSQLIQPLEDFQRSLQILQQRTKKFQKSMRQLDKAVQSKSCGHTYVDTLPKTTTAG